MTHKSLLAQRSSGDLKVERTLQDSQRFCNGFAMPYLVMLLSQ
nr:hypothetical protein [Trichocoleus desertorum]